MTFVRVPFIVREERKKGETCFHFMCSMDLFSFIVLWELGLFGDAKGKYYEVITLTRNPDVP